MKFVFPKEIETTRTAAEQALAKHNRILTAIGAAETEMESAILDIQRARQVLAETERDRVLTESPTEAPSRSLRDLRSSRERADALQARIEGLKLALPQIESELLQAADAFQIARNDFSASMVAGLRPRYEAAVEAFRSVVLEAQGIAAGLGITFSGLDSLHGLPGLQANESGHLIYGYVHGVPQRPAPPAGLSEVKSSADRINRLAGEIRSRREDEQRAAQQAEMEARGPQPTVISYAPLTPEPQLSYLGPVQFRDCMNPNRVADRTRGV